MCAIERHPDGNVRDSLTHTLFNLIKRPDEQQRRIIMDVSYYVLRKPSQVQATGGALGFHFFLFYFA